MPPSTLCPVMVGRDRELGVLLGALGAGGGVFLITGEAGIGKSRLVREFAGEATRRGHPTLWGRPEVVSEPGPYSVVLDLLDELVAKGGPDLEAAALAEALSRPARGNEPPARQIAARTRGLVSRLGRDPVLIIEDLHAADEPSQAVVAHLARSAPDDGTLLIAVIRPEQEHTPGTTRLLDLLHRDHLAQTLALEPLSREGLTAMLHAMWNEAPDETQLSLIERLAEGVPFFVEELAASGGTGEIPSSVATAVESRLSRLSPEARRLVEVAALSDGALDARLLAVVLQFEPNDVPRLALEAIRSGVIADSDGRLVFRHRLIRQSVIENLVTLDRRELHLRIAACIEEFRGADAGRAALTLSHHYSEAGDRSRAARFMVDAGNHALAMGSLSDAAVCFERGLELSEMAEAAAFMGMAHVALRRNEISAAAEHFRRAAALWAEGGDFGRAADAVLEEGFLRVRHGDPDGATQISRAFDLLPEDAPKSRFLFYKAQATHVIHGSQSAAAGLAEAVEAATSEGHYETAVLATLELARNHALSGDVRRAEQWADRADALVSDHRLDHLVGKAYGFRASMASHEGENLRALELLEEARSRLIDGLSSHHIVELELTKATVLWRMGRPAEAERIATRIEFSRLGQGYGRVITVWSALEQDDPDRARFVVDQWWARVGPHLRDMSVEELRNAPESPAGGQFAQLADAVFAAFTVDPSEQDEDRARRYWELCESAVQDVWLQSAWLYGRTLVGRGRVEEAEAVVHSLDAKLSDLPPNHEPYLREILAACAGARGDTTEAIRELEGVESALQRLSNLSARAGVLIRLAALDASRSVELLREALRLATECGATRSARQAEALLRAMGVRPRAGRPKGSGRKDGLSAREEEVITLVATGATNAEVAERLFLSERTVQDHITRAGKRLGISGRAGLAAWAAKQGLI